MEVNWTVLGAILFCAIILIIYLVRKNLKDKKDVTQSFTEQIKTTKKFESDDDDDE
jgi:preprotein translocase subunit SecG